MPIASLLLSIALVCVASTARAQTEATVVDQRMIRETAAGRTDTIVMRTITSKMRYRVEFVSATPSAAAIFRAGRTELMTFGDSGMKMIFVDSTRKIYAEMQPGALFSANAVGAALRFQPTGDSATLDSIGPGPVIVGHKTIHFRLHSSSRITMTVLGDTSTRTIAVTTDSYLAPDMPASDLVEDDSTRLNPAAAGMRSMALAIPGLDATMGQAAKLGKRLASHGRTLKMITEMTTSTAVGAHSQHTSIETLSYERRPVPDALFAIPVAYRKVGLMDFMSAL